MYKKHTHTSGVQVLGPQPYPFILRRWLCLSKAGGLPTYSASTLSHDPLDCLKPLILHSSVLCALRLCFCDTKGFFSEIPAKYMLGFLVVFQLLKYQRK